MCLLHFKSTPLVILGYFQGLNKMTSCGCSRPSFSMLFMISFLTVLMQKKPFISWEVQGN